MHQYRALTPKLCNSGGRKFLGYLPQTKNRIEANHRYIEKSAQSWIVLLYIDCPRYDTQKKLKLLRTLIWQVWAFIFLSRVP